MRNSFLLLTDQKLRPVHRKYSSSSSPVPHFGVRAVFYCTRFYWDDPYCSRTHLIRLPIQEEVCGQPLPPVGLLRKIVLHRLVPCNCKSVCTVAPSEKSDLLQRWWMRVRFGNILYEFVCPLNRLCWLTDILTDSYVRRFDCCSRPSFLHIRIHSHSYY
jgi:hypothetical protein